MSEPVDHDTGDLTALHAGPPGPVAEYARALAARLPQMRFSRYGASLLFRIAGGRKRRGYDVTVFGSQRARLYPFDNISEKRVYITPQFWDLQERLILKSFIEAHGPDEFVFLDVGANAGLYSLFVRSVCQASGVAPAIVAIEPDPTMIERLRYNLANGADQPGTSTILPWAIAAQAGPQYLTSNIRSRGMTMVSGEQKDGTIAVEGHPLIEAITHCGLPRVDAMKMDIEGGEMEALKSFFAAASRDQLPDMMILEISHEGEQNSIISMAERAGYEPVFKNRLNSILRRRT